MGKHIKSERRALSRKRAKALLELQAAAPESYLRFMAAEAGLKQISISDNERYREFRRPAKAALACLDYEQRWLTAQQIADLVERGGYPDWDPIRQQGLFVRALNVSAKRGNIQRVDDKLGKPKWHYPLADPVPDPEKE